MSEGAPADPRRRELVRWLWRLPVVAVALAGGVGVYEAIKVHFLKQAAAAEPEFDAVPATRVAALADFPEVWDEATFELPVSGDGSPRDVGGALIEGALPVLAVRLPGPIPGDLVIESVVAGPSAYLAAFSRICTHQHCTVVLTRDVKAIDLAFNYSTSTPALTCPCHLSVFDPLAGGKAVSGPAVTPLPRVRLELIGSEVFATGIERT